MAVACLPPPVSSAVILTKTVGGNEAGAIFNSAFGSLLGVIITPIELIFFVDSGTSPTDGGGAGALEMGTGAAGGDSSDTVALLLNVFKDLSMTVLVPIVVGQMLRPRFGEMVDKQKGRLSVISSLTLLLVIYTTFCNTFCSSSGSCGTSSNAAAALQLQQAGDERVRVLQEAANLGGELPAVPDLAPLAVPSGGIHSGGGDPLSDLSTVALMTAGLTVVLLQLILSVIVFFLATRYADAFRFNRSDIVAVSEISAFLHSYLPTFLHHLFPHSRLSSFLRVLVSSPTLLARDISLVVVVWSHVVPGFDSPYFFLPPSSLPWQVLFCSVHKSLTLGVPVMKIVFASSPYLSLITLPILMYHPIQIIVGGLLAPSVSLSLVYLPRSRACFFLGAWRVFRCVLSVTLAPCPPRPLAFLGLQGPNLDAAD